MSLLGRAAVSRRVYLTASSSYNNNKPKVLSLAETFPAATSARYFSAPVVSSTGGKPVSEHHQRVSNTKGTRAETWSGWQVAAASFLAAAATGSLIAYPRAAAQNEPSVDAATATANDAPLQRHSVGIVQRGQNRSSHLQYYATTDEDATTPFWGAMETSNLASTGGGSYDVSGSFFPPVELLS